VISVEQSSNTTHITGIAAQPTGTEITICNRETSVGVVKLDYETGSTSANQIVLPGAASFGFPWEIQPGACLKLRYGGSNWMFISSGTSLLPYIHVRNGADLDGSTTVNQLKYTPQIDTSTGTVDNFVLFSTTTAIVWGGAGDATFTGMIGGGDGRMACIINASSGKTLTLANMSGSSSHPYQNIDNKDSPLVGAGSFACYIYDATASPAPWRMYSWGSSTNPAATSFTSSKNKGTITLSTGTGTATVNAGAICTCQDTSGTPTLVSCAVSSTTLTATGTGTDAIAYLCF
jgi:hypothetical protein